ncbi:redoxin family protein [bacterium]|nr:redoxin family protein [bacterium]
MKRIGWLSYSWALAVSLLVSGSLQAASTDDASKTLPNITFKDIRYLHRTLSDLAGPKDRPTKGFLVVFMNTTCPVAQRYLPKLKTIDAEYGPKGIQVVGLYTAQEETINDIASHALENGVKYPVGKDTDLSAVRALGVERVPQVVLMDAERHVLYSGRIDDQYRIGGTQPRMSRSDVTEALEEFLAGKAISVAQTPVDGCKITPWSPPSAAEPVTFHEHVSKVMQARCQNCHHEGGATPFSLVSYDDVKSQAEMVAEVVGDRRMPPWYASPKYGHFQNDPSMTKEERDIVLAWVKQGMPEGDSAKAPAPLAFSTSRWKIGEPDLVVKMKQEHDIPAEGYIKYYYVMLPYIFKEDTYVDAIEIRPINKSVVHHCNMAYGNLLQGKFGRETFITGYVPGGQPMVLGQSNNVAFKIPKGSTLFLQIHYTTTGKPEKGQLEVGFRYAKGLVQKTTHFMVLDPRGIEIPPGESMYELRETHPIPRNATLLGMFTHMHVRGRDMTYLAHYPDGKTETLLQIPNYNFEWQLGYECPPPPKECKIPAGTKIEAIAHYDNSAFNPYNPDPNRTVPYGDQTYDEMFNGFVFWVYDDEELNLTIDPKTGHVVGGEKIAGR